MVYVNSETEFYQLKVKVTQSCPTLCDPMHYTVHGILQARILEWVAIPLYRESSQPMNQIQVSHNAGGFFTSWATREAQPAQERPFLKEILQKLFFAAVFFPNWQCSLSSVFWLGEFMLITSYFSESSCDTERMKSHWETRFCMHHVLRRAAAQICLELLSPPQFLLWSSYSQKPIIPRDCTFCILCYSCFNSYDHELVFGVSMKNMNKAERLTFGESLMTHAMTFTAVSEKVWPPACRHQYLHRGTSIPLRAI